DYLRPTLLGIEHLHKPPLTYYITSLGYKIFGINEYGARFFLGIALIFQIYLVFRIGFLLFKDQKIAFASALIYSSFPLVLIAVRNLTTDAYLVTFILWSIFLWLTYNQSQKIIYLYAFFTVLGLAFLTKGPVELIPPLLFIGCWKYFNKEKIKFSLHVFFGTLLMLAISGSWFLAIILDDPTVFDYFIQEQIINRVSHAEQFHRSQPFWYYLILAPALGLPWLIFIIAYFGKRLKETWEESNIIKVLITTSSLLLIIFSLFSSKLVLYILPIFPFIAFLGSILLYKFSEKQVKWFSRSYYILYTFLILALLGSIFYSEINVDLLQISIILLITISCLIYFFKISKIKDVSKLLYFGAGFTICLLLWHTSFASSNPNEIHSFKTTAGYIQQLKGEKLNSLIIYDDFLPSAQFYINSDIISVQDNNYRSIRDTRFENDTLYKKHLINLKDPSDLNRFKQLFQKDDQVYIERKKSPINDSLSYLLKTFTHKIEKDSWFIYY
ncbi:MAG TPA: glycosyltransferase family 39 protein, partial [Gillisia sp.]|nr:glycosyltransferase family 39 protein [Gillisia sp.]